MLELPLSWHSVHLSNSIVLCMFPPALLTWTLPKLGADLKPPRTSLGPGGLNHLPGVGALLCEDAHPVNMGSQVSEP